MQAAKHPLDQLRRYAAFVLDLFFTVDVVENTVCARLTETAIAFKLRFTKPLIRRWLLREKRVLDCVLTHVRGRICDDRRFEVEDEALWIDFPSVTVLS